MERFHQLKDVEEDFVVAKAAATDPVERRRLDMEMYKFRSQHRLEDVARGKRSAGPGMAVVMQQIMWARWIEVAAEQEAAALDAFNLIAAGETQHLPVEFRHSLVAVTAAAYTVEALFEDVKYLVPDRRPLATLSKTISEVLGLAFGLPTPALEPLKQDLTWLFDLRNEAAHAYTEPEAPGRHPAGLNTSAATARFNGPQSHHALQVALSVIGHAEQPPAPANRWVVRWVSMRSDYFTKVVAPIRAASAASTCLKSRTTARPY